MAIVINEPSVRSARGLILVVYYLFIAELLPSSCHAVPTFAEKRASYIAQRTKLLSEEAKRSVGSSLILNEKEERVNEIILAVKRREFERGFVETFPPTVNFLIGKPLVEKSAVFDIIRRMPKGGILHTHESIVDPRWIIDHVTYLPDLYFCAMNNAASSLRFRFSAPVPPNRLPECRTDWVLVAAARKDAGAGLFDNLLYSNFTLSTPDPDGAYPNATAVWQRFEQALLPQFDLYFNVGTFRALVKQSFQQMMDDNVQYVELRSLLLPLQDLDGNSLPPEHTLQQYIEAIEEFKKENPKDFIGAKIIYHTVRVPVNEPLISDAVELAVDLRRKYPDYFAGYDLVAQEDLGGPLIDYIDSLLYPSQNGFDLPFFFHAGETNWQGTSVDQNLIDAILLNTSRIGHGYAINKHHVVMETARARGIAIEINPVSNQVLHLVHDLRNHVGASLIADDYPVVVSSDDSAIWGALPLSHDYYMAFMGMSGQETGLALLKQLALNTIKYSAMTADEKKSAIELWQAKWDIFIDDILHRYTLDGHPTECVEPGHMRIRNEF